MYFQSHVVIPYSSLKLAIDADEVFLIQFKFRIGLLIGRYPLRVITISFISVAVCSLGFLRFTEENRVEKLWVPSTADSIAHMEWVDKNFPSKYHIESLICVANTKSTNVIKPEPLQQVIQYSLNLAFGNSSRLAYCCIYIVIN